MELKSTEELSALIKVGSTGGTRTSNIPDLLIDEAGRFRLSSKLYNEMELADNSLDERISQDGNNVYLVTCAGNSGVFMKRLDRPNAKKKGRGFTNAKLLKDLRDLGMNGSSFSVVYVGKVENTKFFQITPIV